MARKKQTTAELKLYQIDTMKYLTPKNIVNQLALFSEFIDHDGVAIADNLSINRAVALERFDKNFLISDIKNQTSTGQANETWLRKAGFLNSINGKYELSDVAKAIINDKISLSDYCFLILSKQWIKIKGVGGVDEYKYNLLALLFEDLLNSPSVTKESFVSHLNSLALNKYKEDYDNLALSNQDAARYLVYPLLLSGIITETSDSYTLSEEIRPIAEDYLLNYGSIRKIDEVECQEETYWNTFQFGFYDMVSDSNIMIYSKVFPNLFSMQGSNNSECTLPLQLIYYGAPGTGKSHIIKENEDVKAADEKELVFRTTFHPDSDYSTFVGAYKPTTVDAPRLIEFGSKLIQATDDNKKPIFDKRIIYEFVPQAFLQAYVAAWNNPEERAFLVIEEINRGNCAQIFGDLFQLLDRDEEGYSEYPIKADNDLAKFLKGKDEKGQEVLTNKDGIKDDKLKLPNNLYIWATMNTSDQSLFPIDSAFKRRWDWEYLPISYQNTEWKIMIGTKQYRWVDFQKIINGKIYDVDNNSEDKQLGDYFVNADRTGNIISAETLLNKILFYLWNDVCKDDPGQIFQWKDDNDNNKDKSIKFSEFFCGKDEMERKLQGFMAFNGINAFTEGTAQSEGAEEEDQVESDSNDSENNDVNA